MMRVADYIGDFLAEHGITQLFSVTGGGAMYLNDAFGHNQRLRVMYNHHEQASAMAAEAYARMDNTMAAVCVTTGPGATNAITGVVCGWMDSIPMMIFSGQARYATTVYASGLKLRTRGVQEFDIIEAVAPMTKYAVLVRDAQSIRYHLERALYTAREGRPGPVWLDIPLDVQGAQVDPDALTGFTPDAEKTGFDAATIDAIIDKIASAKRPVLFAGNGVRLSGGYALFRALADTLQMPVVTGMSSVDAMPTAHPLFAGRSGTTGDRAGNFAVQNCDLLLSLGSRLGYFQTGFNTKAWARGAYKIINDIDAQELEKDSIHADMKVCGDAKQLIAQLLERLCGRALPDYGQWTAQCARWRQQYPVVQQKHYDDAQPNIYAFYDDMTKQLTGEDALVISVGTSRVAGSQAGHVKDGMRVITNPSTAAMGYCLPAAIGVAAHRAGGRTVLVTGEGSLQMNLQELQTIVQNRLPIVIFVMNNHGYHSIRMTQKAFFSPPLVGMGEESGDLSFPDLEKIAGAYGIAFRRCDSMRDMHACTQWALSQGLCICEMMLSACQPTEPKVASRKLEDGRMVSGTLEDMAPFLSREELAQNMYIPLWTEDKP